MAKKSKMRIAGGRMFAMEMLRAVSPKLGYASSFLHMENEMETSGATLLLLIAARFYLGPSIIAQVTVEKHQGEWAFGTIEVEERDDSGRTNRKVSFACIRMADGSILPICLTDYPCLGTSHVHATLLACFEGGTKPNLPQDVRETFKLSNRWLSLTKTQREHIIERVWSQSHFGGWVSMLAESSLVHLQTPRGDCPGLPGPAFCELKWILREGDLDRYR